MGLTTAVVKEQTFRRQIRTIGVVTADEGRTTHVHARVRGWIQSVHVQRIGQRVTKGAPLASLYSEEVHAAQLELVALKRSRSASPQLLEQVRKRLALWEVPQSIVDQVERTGEPERTFPLLATRSGVIVGMQAFEGALVDPARELYTITDLSHIRVLADIDEADAAEVGIGSEATITIDGLPAPMTAKVAFLSPTFNDPASMLKARFDLSNPAGAIMPGAFATVELVLDLGRGLALPERAIIRTDTRSIVFVIHPTYAEPREVKLGARFEDMYRVESGLEAGAYVATGAQLLLDSESRLRAMVGAEEGLVDR